MLTRVKASQAMASCACDLRCQGGLKVCVWVHVLSHNKQQFRACRVLRLGPAPGVYDLRRQGGLEVHVLSHVKQYRA